MSESFSHHSRSHQQISIQILLDKPYPDLIRFSSRAAALKSVLTGYHGISRGHYHIPAVTKFKVAKSLGSKSLRFSRVAVLGGIVAGGIVAFATPVFASEAQVHSPHLPWSHDGIISSFDHSSVRRGYQVYKEVCAACHSMKHLTYRQLVNAVLTEDEAKTDAAEMMVPDGPDSQGHMFERPGRLTDTLPMPYPNVEAARAANNGAAPPDLTFIVKAREGNENYVYHLLTGYCEPPAGKEVPDGQYYNPYFPGGRLSMARPLYAELIEYADGTIATTSQMAKDVSTFLCWSADRNHDQRKRFLFKALIMLSIGAVIAGIYKRKRWSNIKSRKLMYKNRPMPKDI